MSEWLILILLFLGAGLMLLAAIGLLRMPDLLCRMHATTKAGALGAGLVMAAVAVHSDDPGVVARALAIVAFIVITMPVAAHVIARASYIVGVPMWPGTVKDDLRDRYNPDTGILESGLEKRSE